VSACEVAAPVSPVITRIHFVAIPEDSVVAGGAPTPAGTFDLLIQAGLSAAGYTMQRFVFGGGFVPRWDV
jgi:hypothetical protein